MNHKCTRYEAIAYIWIWMHQNRQEQSWVICQIHFPLKSTVLNKSLKWCMVDKCLEFPNSSKQSKWWNFSSRTWNKILIFYFLWISNDLLSAIALSLIIQTQGLTPNCACSIARNKKLQFAILLILFYVTHLKMMCGNCHHFHVCFKRLSLAVEIE